MVSSITIISEDLVSEVVAEKILATVGLELQVGVRLGRRGYNYVVNRLRNLNEAAVGMIVFALLDRDTLTRCPIEVIGDALGGFQHQNMIIRFAEMEVESWILADRESAANFLCVQLNRFPAWPDVLPDPKQSLVNLAGRSRSKQIRADICPSAGSTARVGPAYNEQLEHFVRTQWRADIASASSPSLARAMRRIAELRIA